MKSIALSLFLSLALALFAHAGPDTPIVVPIPSAVNPKATNPPAAAKYKSKLREDEPNTESFSAKVKVVRTVQGDTEIFFESEKARGAYLLPSTLKDFNLFKQRLQKSLAVGGPQVNITADGEKRIQNVEIKEDSNPSTAPTEWDKI